MAKLNRKDERRERFLREAARLYDAFIDRAGPGSTDTFDDMEEQSRGCGARPDRADVGGSAECGARAARGVVSPVRPAHTADEDASASESGDGCGRGAV